YNLNGIGAAYDDRVTRGGPALRRNFRQSAFLGFETDGRKPVTGVLQGFFALKDASGSSEWGVDPAVNFRAGGNVQGSVTLNYFEGVNDQQWYNNYATPGGTAYTFARLEQTTMGVTTRLDYTMTPTLSL